MPSSRARQKWLDWPGSCQASRLPCPSRSFPAAPSLITTSLQRQVPASSPLPLSYLFSSLHHHHHFLSLPHSLATGRARLTAPLNGCNAVLSVSHASSLDDSPPQETCRLTLATTCHGPQLHTSLEGCMQTISVGARQGFEANMRTGRLLT